MQKSLTCNPMEQLSSPAGSGLRHVFTILVAIICTLLAVLNISVANVAFSDISRNLAISPDKASWVTTIYSLANIAIMPFSSRLSRQFGRRNYFAVAVMLFTVSSFFCGNATGIRELVIFRFLQGLGGGSMLVLSHTIITESWPVEKRATSQAFFMLGMIAGGALVQPLSGYIVDNFSWPFIFFANIPAGIIACLLVLTCVRNLHYEKEEDWFDIGVLRNMHVRTGLILSFIVAFGVAITSMVIIQWTGRHMQPPAISLWTTILGTILALAVTAILIEKGKMLKYLIAIGLLLSAISSYMLYRAESGHTGSVYISWILMVGGPVAALISVSVSTLALSKLRGKEIGQGVALYHIMRQLGAALGMALLSICSRPAAAPVKTDLLNQLNPDDPEVKQRVADALSAMGRDTGVINHKVSTFTQANTENPSYLILVVGIVLLVCIPLFCRRD